MIHDKKEEKAAIIQDDEAVVKVWAEEVAAVKDNLQAIDFKSDKPILAMKNLCKNYQLGTVEVQALRNINLIINEGEYVAIMGPSGSGKSTLLNMIGCLDRPSSGKYHLGGQDVSKLDDDNLSLIRGARIGFVFQQFHLIPYLSLRDNILTAALTDPSAPAQTRADTLMAEYGLQARAHHLPAALSIGERQRTALARAMLNEPQVILADEPTGNLDPDNSAGVLESLSRFADSGGVVLMVTHNPDNAGYASRWPACSHLIHLAR